MITADASRLPTASQQYNLVFLDAPYNKGLSEVALKSLSDKNWLAEGAWVLVELEKNEVLEHIPFFEQAPLSGRPCPASITTILPLTEFEVTDAI